MSNEWSNDELMDWLEKNVGFPTGRVFSDGRLGHNEYRWTQNTGQLPGEYCIRYYGENVPGNLKWGGPVRSDLEPGDNYWCDATTAAKRLGARKPGQPEQSEPMPVVGYTSSPLERWRKSLTAGKMAAVMYKRDELPVVTQVLVAHVDDGHTAVVRPGPFYDDRVEIRVPLARLYPMAMTTYDRDAQNMATEPEGEPV